MNLKKVNRVTKIIMHPKWRYLFYSSEDDYVMRGDLAILHLLHPIIESDTVKIIPIIDKTPLPGSEATLTGWGRIRYRENATEDDSPVMLQTIKLKIISKYQCNRDLIEKRFWQKIQVPRLFICANNPSGSACSVSI